MPYVGLLRGLSTCVDFPQSSFALLFTYYAVVKVRSQKWENRGQNGP